MSNLKCIVYYFEWEVLTSSDAVLVFCTFYGRMPIIRLLVNLPSMLTHTKAP